MSKTALLVTACVMGATHSHASFAQPADNTEAVAVSSTGSAPAAPDTPASRAARNAIPLSPEMIEDLARRYRTQQQAIEQGSTELAAPVNRQVNLSYAPGAATSIVATMKGYTTAVSFFDSTGQPWPIQWDTNSNPSATASAGSCNPQNSGAGPSVAAVGFFVCAPTKGGNVLDVTPMSFSPRGSLVVSLEGSPKPFTFLLMPGAGRYDASISVHVAERGPRAKAEIMTQSGAPETGAAFLTGMLEGVPPSEAVPLSVEGVSPEGLRAWRLGRNVYLRTRYTLLSPEWTASEAEAGTTVYAVPNTPVVLLSVNGRTVSAQLKE